MARKKDNGELDIFSDLGGMVSELNATLTHDVPKQEIKVVELPPKKEEVEKKEKLESKKLHEAVKSSRTKDVVTVKFEVPKEDHKEFMRIFSAIQYKLDARINLAQLGRGWVTRFITAESELMTAADNHERLKTPNRRDTKDLAEVDQAMAQIQSKAFRRAKPL